MAMVTVLVEIENHGDDYLENTIALLESRGFEYDRTYKPQTIERGKILVIRGDVDEKDMFGLEIVRGVVQVSRLYDSTKV